MSFLKIFKHKKYSKNVALFSITTCGRLRSPEKRGWEVEKEGGKRGEKGEQTKQKNEGGRHAKIVSVQPRKKLRYEIIAEQPPQLLILIKKINFNY